MEMRKQDMKVDVNLEIIDFKIESDPHRQITLFLGKNGNQKGEGWGETPWETSDAVLNKEYIEDHIILRLDKEQMKTMPYDVEVFPNANGMFTKQDFANGYHPAFYFKFYEKGRETPECRVAYSVYLGDSVRGMLHDIIGTVDMIKQRTTLDQEARQIEGGTEDGSI